MSGDKTRKQRTTWNDAVASATAYLLMLVLTLGVDLHFEISVIMREWNVIKLYSTLYVCDDRVINN